MTSRRALSALASQWRRRGVHGKKSVCSERSWNVRGTFGMRPEACGKQARGWRLRGEEKGVEVVGV
eukprot:6025673-Pleurochrysis_carterae.AAC.1